MTAEPVRRFTADEVLAWPPDGVPHEVIDGVLFIGGEPVMLGPGDTDGPPQGEPIRNRANEARRVYTRAELRDPTARPRVRRAETYRVAAPRAADPADDLNSRYALPSPCCGVITQVPQYAVDRMADGESTWFECGKPFYYVRGNPRGGGCRAHYRITPVGDPARPEAFDVTWTGQ